MSPSRTEAACLAASFAALPPVQPRDALAMIALRESIRTAVLLSQQAGAAHMASTDDTPESQLFALDSAALEARDDMRDAFADIGIDRTMLRELAVIL